MTKLQLDGLTEPQWLRYQRQLHLPMWKASAQKDLSELRVLVVGMGGLGCPVSLYLAGAGVGTLGLVDADTVSLSNLQRQILYTTGDVGLPKVEAASQRLSALNPHVEIEIHAVSFDVSNAVALISNFDLVIDGTDNLKARYLINDVCQALKKPWVYGSVYRLEGQVASFDPGTGCYRCMYPEPPPLEAVPSCVEAGVLGVVPGVVANLQATEVLRQVSNWGQGLSEHLLMIDLQSMAFHKIQRPVNSSCKACALTEASLNDYLRLKAVEATTEISVPALSAAEALPFQKKYPERTLDVRTSFERTSGSLTGLHCPLQDLKQLSKEKLLDLLNPDVPLLVYCQKGMRSAQAVSYLQSQGFSQLFSLSGGYEALHTLQSHQQIALPQ